MNRLFRIGAASLAAVLLLSLAGCSGTPDQGGTSSAATTTTAAKPDVWALFKTAAEKSGALTSVNADYTVKVKVEVEGSAIATNISGNVKSSGEGDARKAAVTGTMEMLGQSVPMASYYADGFSYAETLGMKIKTPVSYEDFAGEAGYSFADTDEMNETDFKSAAVTEENGLTKIALPMSEALAEKLAGTAAESAAEGLGETKFTDFKAVFVIDAAGYLSEMTVDCTASATMDLSDPTGSGDESAAQQEMTMVINMAMKYVNPGEEVTVTLPENLDEYEDMGDLSGLDA